SFPTRRSSDLDHYINGKPFSDADRPAAVYNPATGRIALQVELASRSTVERAIAAAHEAFPAWRATQPLKRARILFKYKELLERNADRVVAAIVAEHGKVWEDAHGE